MVKRASGGDSDAKTLPYETRERPRTGASTGVSTLVSPADSQPGPAVASGNDAFERRYELGALIGAGGMGEVRSCFDRHVGREVAVKLLRLEHAQRADLRARFDREAKIQGRLEHPSVVPLYDMGERADGSVYFTMKHVHGHTLEQVIAALAGGDPELSAAFPLRRLLSAFSNLCLSIAFAHSRGIVHRDLKPGNVILGEFGEVNVLDWGVAKVVAGSDEPEPAGPSEPASARAPDITAKGAIMGTPGYMAPEQARGLSDPIDGRTDVYALGAMLFELLTLQPLHPRDSIGAALRSTLDGADARASVRAPERGIAPELDDICVRATALEPAERFATARELHEALERFLDGDRDLARRRELARAHTQSAESALAAADASPQQSLARRAQALRELGAALALDPGHGPAVRALARLLTDAPERLPPAAEAELKLGRDRARVRGARASALGFSGILMLLPVMPALGVESWAALAPVFALAFAMILLSLRMGARRAPRPVHVAGIVLTTAAFAASLSVLFGPYVLPPVAALASGLWVIVQSRSHPRTLRIVFAASLLAVLGPIVAQWLGPYPASVRFDPGRIAIDALAIRFSLPAQLLLVASLLFAVLFPLAVAARSIAALARAERRLFAQAWQLGQLIPDAARGSSIAPPPESVGHS